MGCGGRKTGKYEDLEEPSNKGRGLLDRGRRELSTNTEGGKSRDPSQRRLPGAREASGLKCFYSIDEICASTDLCFPDCCDYICGLLISGRQKNETILFNKFEKHCDKHLWGFTDFSEPLMSW